MTVSSTTITDPNMLDDLIEQYEDTHSKYIASMAKSTSSSFNNPYAAELAEINTQIYNLSQRVGLHNQTPDWDNTNATITNHLRHKYHHLNHLQHHVAHKLKQQQQLNAELNEWDITITHTYYVYLLYFAVTLILLYCIFKMAVWTSSSNILPQSNVLTLPATT